MSSSPPVPISALWCRSCRASCGVFQVNASDYRNPEQLPPGAVLVAGAGASGAQIAEELQRAGRRVYLSVGRHRRMPRRYRSRDFIWWLAAMRIDHITPEQRGPARLGPVISGAYGGRTIDFRNFAADGMILVGHLEAAQDGVIEIAPGLADSLANGDLAFTTFLDIVDEYVKRRGLQLPEEPGARTTLPDPPCVTAPLQRLDLAAEGITSVIWATGYGVDFGWIDVPVIDAKGDAGPQQRHHVRARPVFPRPAMAVEAELLVPVRRRRRCRRARRPHSARR